MDRKTVIVPNGDKVPLRDYVDIRFEAVCNEFGARFIAIDRERAATEKTIDARLDSMNEFRQAMLDQARTYMTKHEYQLAHQPLAEDAQEFHDFMAKHQGKASQNQVLFAYGLAFLSMLIGIVLHFVK